MNLIKLAEAVELLVQNGILGAETKQKEQAVKRLLNNGLILGEKPPVNQPKIGWKVDLDSLNEYIQIGNLKKADMVRELIELRRKVRALEFQQVQTNDDVSLEEAIESVTSEQTDDSDAPDAPENVVPEGEGVTLPEEEKTAPGAPEHDFTVSKVVVLGKEDAKTYKVEFLLNKERFEGLVTDEFGVQLLEISNNEKKYTFGADEEQSDYLEALTQKMSANLRRKIETYNKKNG